MRIRLMESTRRRESSAGATAVSVLLHAAVIGLAAYATLEANTGRAAPVALPPSIIFVPTPDHPAIPAGGQRRPSIYCGRPDCFAPPIATRVEPPDPFIFAVAVHVQPELPLFPAGGIDAEPRIRVPAGAGGDPVDSAEIPATPWADNPLPAYPSLLRDTRVTGIVNARFVVDTTGRVEPASITFDEESDRLFQQAVRRALLGSRFHPATNAGRRVRMLVRQDFLFRLTS